jgi:putative transposase
LFGVNRQVYYRRIRAVKRRKSRAVQVIELVESIRLQMPKIGARKLYFILEDELKRLNVGRDMLFRILKANHMLIQPKRRYHITTNSHHRFRKHKNLVENVVPEQPEQIWVSDITYVGNRQNPMYLALVTDAYSKQIMGYDLSNSLDVSEQFSYSWMYSTVVVVDPSTFSNVNSLFFSLTIVLVIESLSASVKITCVLSELNAHVPLSE